MLFIIQSVYHSEIVQFKKTSIEISPIIKLIIRSNAIVTWPPAADHSMSGLPGTWDDGMPGPGHSSSGCMFWAYTPWTCNKKNPQASQELNFLMNYALAQGGKQTNKQTS